MTRRLISAALLGTVFAAPAMAQQAVNLTPGAVLDVRVVPEQQHSYAVQLRSGESAELVVQQDGVDVAVEVRDPSGRLLDSIDSPNGRSGPEPVSIVAGLSGRYSIIVRPLSGEPAGNVQVRFPTHRTRAATAELLRQRRAVRQEAADWLRPRSMALPVAALGGAGAISPLDAATAQARVIGLGEATHGSRELNDVRLGLVKWLVERHGYRVIALEDSAVRWRELAGYLSGTAAAPPPGAPLEWHWIGRRARHELLLWVRQWNLDHPRDQVAVVGVDGQDNDPARLRIAAFVADAYGADSAKKWADVETELAAADEQVEVFGDSGVSAATRQAVLELSALMQQDERLLRARLGADRVQTVTADVRDLVQVVDFNGGGGLTSHSRDWYMAANVLAALGDDPKRKGIYWGHNAHVSARPTRGGPTGALLREALGCGYQALATSFGSGSFVAQLPNDPEDRLIVSTVGRAQEESIDNVLAMTGSGPRLVWWGCGLAETAPPEWLREPHPMRWVGGIYARDTAPTGSYQPYRLTQSFDGAIYFPSVTADDPGPKRPVVPARKR